MTQGVKNINVDFVKWHEVRWHQPPQKTLLMVTGDSGYRSHKKFLTLAYYDEEYRSSGELGELRWINVQNDLLSDQGWTPTHWAHVMELP